MKLILTLMFLGIILLSFIDVLQAAERRAPTVSGSLSASGRIVTMSFEFIDACDDNYSPEIEFYLKDNPGKYWGTFWLQYYNEPLKTNLSCEQDKEICFGAWLNDTSWGCGKKCVEPAKAACFPCREATVTIGLECNL